MDTNKFLCLVQDLTLYSIQRGEALRTYIIDSILDTVVSFPINLYASNVTSKKSLINKSIFLAGSRESILQPNRYSGFIQKLYPNGFLEWEYNFDTLLPTTFTHDFALDTADNVYSIGRYEDTSVSDIFITKVNTFGQQEWFRRYRWWAGYQVPYSIKQLQNGRFLVSGSVGSQIGTMEIDENGTVTRPFSVLYTPTSRSTAFNTVCTPLPNNKLLFVGNQFNRSYYYGVADGTTFQIDWVREQFGYPSFPGVYSSENTFVLCENDSANLNTTYSKYDFTGRMLWRFPVPTSQFTIFYIKDILPTLSGNGLAFGSQYTRNPNRSSGLLQWIANVGRPAPPLYQSRQQGVVSTFCYPSPARGSTVMSLPLDHGLPSVSITLTSQLGQQQHRTALVGNGGYEVPLHDLASGLYTLQTTVAGKTYRARVVVE